MGDRVYTSVAFRVAPSYKCAPCCNARLGWPCLLSPIVVFLHTPAPTSSRPPAVATVMEGPEPRGKLSSAGSATTGTLDEGPPSATRGRRARTSDDHTCVQCPAPSSARGCVFRPEWRARNLHTAPLQSPLRWVGLHQGCRVGCARDGRQCTWGLHLALRCPSLYPTRTTCTHPHLNPHRTLTPRAPPPGHSIPMTYAGAPSRPPHPPPRGVPCRRRVGPRAGPCAAWRARTRWTVW